MNSFILHVCTLLLLEHLLKLMKPMNFNVIVVPSAKSRGLAYVSVIDRLAVKVFMTKVKIFLE